MTSPTYPLYLEIFSNFEREHKLNSALENTYLSAPELHAACHIVRVTELGSNLMSGNS